MEAASARYAARDRFGPTFTEPAQTPLQRYIQNAVDPQNFEPNLALDLEISDLINSKKGNAPREAAVAIVNYINHRNPNVSILALTLLDICVKNCGYPFHLQISTKEFLNELVRRFPERPPIRPTRVQLKILEAIEEWRQTICQTSRYKEDLGFIRDMHRLLSYKGYMFPEVRREDAAVLNPSDNLKSADEMEEEEKAAQSAKLQELIRRGGPEDLQEANRLMKVMAGYDTKNKTDYRAKAAEEVGKIQQKAKILEERLQNFSAGDKVEEGDVFEELANALQSAQPKIQKMCEEESDDQEAVAKLLEINDSIHRTIERYKLVKKGDLDAASKIPKGTLGTSTGVSRTADNELSLIDLGGDPEPSTAGGDLLQAGGPAKTDSFEADLLGLSMQEQTYGQGGGIALGFGANTNVPGPSLLSSTIQQSTAKYPTPVPTPHPQPQQLPVASKPNYDAFAGISSPRPVSQSVVPPPMVNQQQAAAAVRPPQTPSDPFASLSKPTSRTASPFPSQQKPQQPVASPATSMFNFAQPALQAPAQQTNGTSADDDWNFTSALPDDGSSLPTTNHLVVSNTAVHISFAISRPSDRDSVINVLAKFSNATPSPITEYTFQVAVSKSYTLRLTPQSGRNLLPNQRDGITQPIEINGVAKGHANAVKMRWKASYKLAGDFRQEQGEVPALGIV
ncbi:MAG: vhs domain-containing [Lasallia pustulata]|uniref:Vhs domain-containing n=1 Tax=Lasallia pustulata TaxID=136370 RepID=A0A5M8PHY4_9LECA|nr:MAG: vhs domain-containing [Lasallia pustulata]